MSKQKEWLLHSKKVKIKEKEVKSGLKQLSKKERSMCEAGACRLHSGRNSEDAAVRWEVCPWPSPSASPLISLLRPSLFSFLITRYAIKISIKENPLALYNAKNWHCLSTYQELSYSRPVYYAVSARNKPRCRWGNRLSDSLSVTRPRATQPVSEIIEILSDIYWYGVLLF